MTPRALATVACALVCAGTAIRPAAAGSFEDEVRARWRGAWVVVHTEVYSDCSGKYYANKVSGSFVTNRGGFRLEPGELGKVDRVQLRRRRVDLMVTLAVPRLISWDEGPFTLYDERTCAVSLMIQIPREMTDNRNIEGIDRYAAKIVDRFATRQAAFESPDWNGRELEPYPEDYELTLARLAAWRAQQTNLEVDRRRDAALEEVKTTGKLIDGDPRYLEGFGAGAEVMRRWPEQDCGSLIDRVFEHVRQGVPEEHRTDSDEDAEWRKGFEDGQRLLYNIVVLERLETCYVPVPAVPGETPLTEEELSAASVSNPEG